MKEPLLFGDDSRWVWLEKSYIGGITMYIITQTGILLRVKRGVIINYVGVQIPSVEDD